jgi:serine/threonine-protein kinase RsbT
MSKTSIQINVDGDIVVARSAGRELAREMGFGSADQTRLATAISELTRNVIQYAGSGVCTVIDESANETAGIRVTVEDHGPGIPDVERAMADGFSTGGGLGAGLPGTRRLVHEFSIESEPGHTKVTIAMARHL